MKIAVVNYNELNNCPSNEQVIDDIRRLFLYAPIDIKEDMGKDLREKLDILSNIESPFEENLNSIYFFDTSKTSSRYKIEQFIEETSPDLLVSYNLAGFELSTLADSLVYNLINCRQFHIIKKKNLPNEIYLSKLRSLNLFLFEDY